MGFSLNLEAKLVKKLIFKNYFLGPYYFFSEKIKTSMIKKDFLSQLRASNNILTKSLIQSKTKSLLLAQLIGKAKKKI